MLTSSRADTPRSLTAERESGGDYLVESLAPRERARLLARRGVPAEVCTFALQTRWSTRPGPYHREMLAVFALELQRQEQDVSCSSQGVEAACAARPAW